jgi:hypothetical protein
VAFQPHYKLSVTGVLGPLATSLEIFSYGLQFGVPGITAGTFGPLPGGTLTSISGAVSTYHASVGASISSSATVTAMKIAEVDTAGHYINPPQIIGPANVPGGSGAALLPPQVSYAVSLTGPPAVSRIRGRWYVPMPTQTVSNTLLTMTTANALAAATAAKTFLASLRSALVSWQPTVDIIIASQRLPVGTNALVTEVRVGTAFDTQRRRRNNLTEVYSTLATP